MHSFMNSRQLCPISSDQQDMLYSVCGQSIQAWSICVTAAAAGQLPGEQGTQVEQQQQVLLSFWALQHIPSALLLTAEQRAPTVAPSYGIVGPCQLRKLMESPSTKQSLPEEPWLPLFQVKNHSLIKIYD